MIKDKLLLSLGFSCALSLVANAEKKPNVVFIIADDLAYNAMADLGDDIIETPNLDRLRKSGAYFTHAFNQGAYSPAVSLASRTMLNTGKYIWRVPARKGKKQAGTEAEPTKFWGNYMQEAGYKTYMAGKWHVSTAATTIFNVTKNVRSGMPKTNNSAYAASEKNAVGRAFDPKKKDKWSASDKSIGGYWEGGKHWSEVLKDDALGFFKQASKDKDPYFMYLGFNAPHDPRQSPQEFLDKYKAEDIAVPKSFMPVYKHNVEMGAPSTSLRDERLLPYPRTEYSVQVSRKEYYALITHMDVQIGIMLDALEKAGQMKDTYIIFTADHGLSLGGHGLAGKQNMYDETMRVPLFISGPGIKAGTTVDGMVYLQDAMATALEIAGSDAVNQVDFKSLLSLAKGAKTSDAVNDAVYGAYQNLQRMVRSEEYKMILYPKANAVKLFNIKKDPNELNDLAGDKKYSKTMDELFAKLLELQAKTGDKFNIKPCYEAFKAAN